jgi:glycerol-3-phosphate acyltransferase PlsY
MIAVGTVAIIGYLLGSIPFGYLLVRIFRKKDIRAVGSGNIGATNVVRSGAKGLGALTFLLDAAKGYAAVALAGHAAFYSAPPVVSLGLRSIAAMAAVVGHMHPVWLGFKGGKGVATAFGVFVALSPWAALLGLAIFVAVMAIWRYVSLASIASAAAFPILALCLGRRAWSPLFAVAVVGIPLLVIAKHGQNIRRLVAGTEYRFGKAGAA